MVALEAHVEEICEHHGIELAGASRRGRATRWRGGRRQIAIPEVRGQVSYFIALHEIGHLVGPGRSAPRLEAEANAWLWALANSRGRADRRRPAARSPARLQRLPGVGPEPPVPPGSARIPPRDHLFWRLPRPAARRIPRMARRDRIRRHLSFANVASALALFLAIGGGTTAIALRGVTRSTRATSATARSRPGTSAATRRPAPRSGRARSASCRWPPELRMPRRSMGSAQRLPVRQWRRHRLRRWRRRRRHLRPDRPRQRHSGDRLRVDHRQPQPAGRSWRSDAGRGGSDRRLDRGDP